MEVLHNITLDGAEALTERQRLLADGKELSLLCRRRDARGRDVSRTLYFGKSGECAWVASQSLKDPDDIGIDIALPAQTQLLFAAHVERIMLAKQLTNSDPRSPEWFDLDPGIEEFVADLRTEFDVVVDPWA